MQSYATVPRKLLVSTVAALAIAAGTIAASQSHHSVIAQGAGNNGGDCDDSSCIIWGLQNGVILLKINTCTLTITPAVLTGPVVQTIAAGPRIAASWPNLQYGDAAGNLFCTTGFPPSPLVACGALTAGANALARDGATLFAGNDFAGGPVGCLFDPLATVGCGGFAYQNNNGADLVCDPSGRFGLLGEADVPAAGGALYSISRGNGAQTLPRPAGGRITFSGLAFDGMNRLFGSNAVANTLELINPNTGIGAVVMALPATVLDLASDECNSCTEGEPDVGDAPDSTNHNGLTMTAYPAINAAFPSVFDIATGLPPGPFHRLLSIDSLLGANVTSEKDADLLPDADLITNISPPVDLANRDGADDGVQAPLNLPACQLTQFNYILRVLNNTRNRYTNVWFDFNRNGQWGDQIQCTDPDTQQLVTVNEWAVQDQLTTLGVGVHIVTTPQFRSLDPGEPLWMRITLAETTAPTGALDGSGYRFGYEIGETEDYLWTPAGEGVYK